MILLDVVKLIHTDDEHRIFHSHGHSVKEIYELRFGHIKRVVDAVIYPENHDQVEKIVEIARHFNVVLFPYGGGTNVTESLECEENEERMIVSVDMGNMDKILWVDKVNMMCCVEAGIKG